MKVWGGGEPGGNLLPKNGAVFLAAHKLRRPAWHTNPWTPELPPPPFASRRVDVAFDHVKTIGCRLFPMVPWGGCGFEGKNTQNIMTFFFFFFLPLPLFSRRRRREL